jgi:PPOX class probable F420-dependent enzyme
MVRDGIDPGGRALAPGMTTTIPDSHRNLLDQPVATLATLDPEGRPQLTEVWFLAEDGQVKISLNTSRRKVRNLQARPACSVLLLDLANPYRYVEIRGDAVLEPDDDYAFADRLGAKYGADLRTNDGPGERRVVVTVRPARVHTWG